MSTPFSSKDPLGMRQHDPIEKWRAEAEQREREFTEARRQREAAAAANETGPWRRHFEAKLAALEQTLRAQGEELVDLAQAMATACEAFEKMGDCLDAGREVQREEIRSLRTEIARLTARVSETAKAEAYKFARDKNDDNGPPGARYRGGT
jgi:hypothetical protein